MPRSSIHTETYKNNYLHKLNFASVLSQSTISVICGMCTLSPIDNKRKIIKNNLRICDTECLLSIVIWVVKRFPVITIFLGLSTSSNVTYAFS